jgi:HEPN domain-containing protein
MNSPRLAERLLRKANQDLVVLEKWRSDPDIADEVLGFHAQQVAEKMLKAAFAQESVEFLLTHRLDDWKN